MARHAQRLPLVAARDNLKRAGKKMFFAARKAGPRWGEAPRPAGQGIEDAVAWFRANGMLKP